MPAHRITLTFDDQTGELAVEHRCSVTIGEHTVSHSETIDVAEHDASVASVRALIDANRGEMERRTQALAVQHVAAVTGKSTHKQVKLGGTLGAIGGANATKG